MRGFLYKHIRFIPQKINRAIMFAILGCALSSTAHAALNIPITVNLSETVNVTGTPRIPVDVGGTPRYATYTSGTGTNALTFTLSPQAGDVDLDGVTVSSPIDLNGGTIKDAKGNNAALTFTSPNTANVKVNYPSLGMDFVYDADGRYTLNGTAYNDLTSFLTATGGSFTRASIGTYFDSSGTLQTAASGTPRFDYDFTTLAAKGILIEEQRTNSIRNSNMSGVVTGTPGTFPSTWGPGGVGLGTLTQQIVATGTERGLSYFDIRLSGTASTASYVVYTNSTTATAATSGQNWNASLYTKIVSGSTNNAPPSLSLYERNSSGSGIVFSSLALPTTGTLTRTNLTRTLNNASTAYIVSAITFNLTSGMPVDITLRIAAPQLEQGLFPTSYIPTTNAVVTRAADNLTIPTGGWLDASKGTLYNEGYQSYLVTSHPTYLSSLSTGASSNFIATYLTTAAAKNAALNVGGTDYYNLGSGTYIAGSLLKSAITYKANDFRMSADGSLAALVSSGPLPSTTLLYIGDKDGTRTWNGHIRKTKYYPTRITDTQLQLLTQ